MSTRPRLASRALALVPSRQTTAPHLAARNARDGGSNPFPRRFASVVAIQAKQVRLKSD